MRIAKLALALTALAAPAAATSAPTLAVVDRIAAPDGRWDYASWDDGHRRLLVAHGGDVLVIDPSVQPASASRVIGKVDGAHGVLALPGTDVLLVASGKDHALRYLDGTSGAELAKIDVVDDADALLLSADGHTLYVIGGDAGAISVIDVAARRETGRITLQPGLEAASLAGEGMIAVNNEAGGGLDLVDTRAGKLAQRIALPGCTGPTGIASTADQRFALSSCRNGVAALTDLTARRMVRLVPIGAGPDTVIWDAPRHRFLVPCGRSGTLSIIAMRGGRARAEAAAVTEVSARTAALDLASGRVYLPAAQLQPAPAGQRPEMVPGSFHILVLAPSR